MTKEQFYLHTLADHWAESGYPYAADLLRHHANGPGPHEIADTMGLGTPSPLHQEVAKTGRPGVRRSDSFQGGGHSRLSLYGPGPTSNRLVASLTLPHGEAGHVVGKLADEGVIGAEDASNYMTQRYAHFIQDAEPPTLNTARPQAEEVESPPTPEDFLHYGRPRKYAAITDGEKAQAYLRMLAGHWRDLGHPAGADVALHLANQVEPFVSESLADNYDDSLTNWLAANKDKPVVRVGRISDRGTRLVFFTPGRSPRVLNRLPFLVLPNHQAFALTTKLAKEKFQGAKTAADQIMYNGKTPDGKRLLRKDGGEHNLPPLDTSVPEADQPPVPEDFLHYGRVRRYSGDESRRAAARMYALLQAAEWRKKGHKMAADLLHHFVNTARPDDLGNQQEWHHTDAGMAASMKANPDSPWVDFMTHPGSGDHVSILVKMLKPDASGTVSFAGTVPDYGTAKSVMNKMWNQGAIGPFQDKLRYLSGRPKKPQLQTETPVAEADQPPVPEDFLHYSRPKLRARLARSAARRRYAAGEPLAVHPDYQPTGIAPRLGHTLKRLAAEGGPHSTVGGLAAGILHAGDHSQLPILADALDEADHPLAAAFDYRNAPRAIAIDKTIDGLLSARRSSGSERHRAVMTPRDVADAWITGRRHPIFRYRLAQAVRAAVPDYNRADVAHSILRLVGNDGIRSIFRRGYAYGPRDERIPAERLFDHPAAQRWQFNESVRRDLLNKLRLPDLLSHTYPATGRGRKRLARPRRYSHRAFGEQMREEPGNGLTPQVWADYLQEQGHDEAADVVRRHVEIAGRMNGPYRALAHSRAMAMGLNRPWEPFADARQSGYTLPSGEPAWGVYVGQAYPDGTHPHVSTHHAFILTSPGEAARLLAGMARSGLHGAEESLTRLRSLQPDDPQRLGRPYRAPAGGTVVRGVFYSGGSLLPDLTGPFATGTTPDRPAPPKSRKILWPAALRRWLRARRAG